MAKKETVVKTDEAAVEVVGAEPTYTAAEFAASSQGLFDVGPDIVTAAFSIAGIKEATKKDAEKLVKDFASRQVR